MSKTRNTDKNIEFTKKCVEEYRKLLLDTSRRNSLISFRHSERSHQHIRVIDELPDFFYAQIIDGKKLTFQALPEEDAIPPDEKKPKFLRHLEQAEATDEDYIQAINCIDESKDGALDKIKKIKRELRNKIRKELKLTEWKEQKNLTNAEVAIKHKINPSYEMPYPTSRNNKSAIRHTDKFIQTLLKPEEMSRKLSGLNSYIRTDIEESGVNTLYIAFGFLEWYESANSDKKCLSPLLLLQIELEKKQSSLGYTYYVEATGEEANVNLPLVERLRDDFGIKLPEFTADDKPEDYLQIIHELVQRAKVPKKEEWKIRRFITVGRFRFARLVMFNDLNDEKWPSDNNISTNKIVQNLFASRGKPSGAHAKDYDIDTSEVEELVPLLVAPADASQHSSIVDIMKGKNVSIKGPPGTGKSQTITNIIANALAAEKSVLFLAEKMAALNVVYKRLSDANLGTYCLELHSTKAKKSEVLKSIKERLDSNPKRRRANAIVSKIQDFKRHRDTITEYVNVLNSSFGRQNKTIHEYLWGAQLRKDRIGNLLASVSQCKISFEQADLSESELEKNIDELTTIAHLKKIVEAETKNGRHPWSFVSNIDLNPFRQSELISLIERWRGSLVKVSSALDSFNATFHLSVNNNIISIDAFYNRLDKLLDYDVSNLNISYIESLASKGEEATAVLDFVKHVHEYKLSLNAIRYIHSVSSGLDTIEETEGQYQNARVLQADCISIIELQRCIKDLEKELHLWHKSLRDLLTIGRRFGISENDSLDDIHALSQIPDYIASVPREYLLLRTDNLIDETSALRLKSAIDVQRHFQENMGSYELHFDISMMGTPQELRVHAAALGNVGFFSICNSSYRKAKKFIKLASKQKCKFNPEKSAELLRAIAHEKEEKERIEQDNQLQAICGTLFDGIHTDFEQLQQINNWASDVRRRYIYGDEFSISVREWLLKGSMSELDSMKALADDSHFIVWKNKLRDVKGNALSNVSAKKYLDDLTDKIGKLKSILDQMQSLTSDSLVTFANIAEDLPYLHSAKKARDCAVENNTAQEFFADAYDGIDTYIEDIHETGRFIGDCLAIPDLKDGFETFLNKNFAEIWIDFKSQLKNLVDHTRVGITTATKLGNNVNMAFGNSSSNGSWLHIDLANITELLSEALSNRDTLDHWARFNSQYAKASFSVQGDLIQICEQEHIDFKELPIIFEFVVYTAVVNEIYLRNPVLYNVWGVDLDQARLRIKELDKQIVELSKQNLCCELSAAMPIIGNGSGKRSTWTESFLLDNEVDKQRRHIPIRSLIERAGKSIQKIKPCFLMSPLSVAQYIMPGKLKFDLVIIDEASQMRPEDALGGIARADQIVVVGDPQQLPPTSFFQSAGRDDEVDEDIASDAIMDIALSSFRPCRILSRHYRSQHESLIAFSNYHFYDKSLVLFPSPMKNPNELGVRMEYVGGTYTSSLNIDEVDAIVDAALDFMQKYPKRSLGIATMNKAQKDLIEIEMDRAFIEHSYAKKYKDHWQDTLESFFIKNLESVQGDERDAIFISTVYGPDKNGTVMQRFGPINSAVGHRRLNVLFSRAKKNMVIFTSLKPEDIKISNNSSQGVKALKGFLAYAEKGVIDEGYVNPIEEPDSDFEIWVKERLESIGCEVHPQVGVAGYRIDLGVKHPKYPYGYLMGVECDGASYHSSKSARERDIIRQQVLEGLGWHIYRIWSTDWFHNPVKEFEKLKTYIQERLGKL